MIIFINILIVLSFLLVEDKVVIDCPVEDGELVTSVAGFVRGEGKYGGVKILSRKNAKAYSMSEGIVKFIGSKSKAIYIVSGDTTYKYLGLTSELKQGQIVLAGAFIGHLEENFLVLSVKKNGRRVEARAYINCDAKN